MRQSPLFSNINTGEVVYDDVDQATYKGITLKTVFLLFISVIVAAVMAFALPTILANNPTVYVTTLVISSIVGFISVMVGRLSERKAKYASVIYSVCEGLFLGSLSFLAELAVPGAVTTAVFTTLVLFSVMLVLFGTGVMKVGSKFRTICFGLTLGALGIMLVMGILSMFIADYAQYLTIIIIIEAFLLFYGVITLSLNFAEAQNVVERGASKNAEWSVALGLMVSIVYIYVEVIRLIILLAQRKD